MDKAQQVITQTKKWITDIVIGCNFCPFAANVLKQQTVFYKVETATGLQPVLESFMKELSRLDADESIETSFLIIQDGFKDFAEYLDLVEACEKLLKLEGYSGIYQLASFHPQYRFAGSSVDDAANYINRSVYPMLHLLREAGITKALQHYNDPETIPGRNINFAREKGLIYMKMLRDSCFV
jgi:hypothetical protein